MERHTQSTLRSLLEVAGGYGLIVATLWSDAPARSYLALLASLWVLAVVLWGERGEGLGLGVRGFRESLWAVWLALLVAGLTILCAAALKTLHYHYVPEPYPPMFGYLIWAFAQQFILQNLFFSRLLRLTLRPWLAIGFGGMMMAMAHLPNLLLVGTTLLWGAAACWLFFRYRNLYVVGLIHFLLGVTLTVSVPSSIQHNMRVGRGYLQYHPAQLSMHPMPRSPIVPSTVLPAKVRRSIE